MSILFFTFTRSDYSSLKPILKAAFNHETITPRLVVGGSHLLAQFGNSVDAIIEDSFPIWRKLAFMDEANGSTEAIATSYAKLVDGCIKLIQEAKPSAVFVLGDRWEMLGVASAASIMEVPIIHHSGGDLTQGSLDNQNRHAISMLSHLHLVALPSHAQRLIAMGEEEWRISITGEPALTSLHPISRHILAFEKKINPKPPKLFALATFHPTNFDFVVPDLQIEFFIECITSIEMPILLTGSNPDHRYDLFYGRLRAISDLYNQIYFVPNLGASAYYGAMASAALMVGNSSSGIWEAPSFKLPVINIGRRQEGRISQNNVVHINFSQEEFVDALATIKSIEFRDKLANVTNPYYDKDCIPKCLSAITIGLSQENIRQKKFVDIKMIEG